MSLFVAEDEHICFSYLNRLSNIGLAKVRGEYSVVTETQERRDGGTKLKMTLYNFSRIPDIWGFAT
jgi:hypothetical protein